MVLIVTQCTAGPLDLAPPLETLVTAGEGLCSALALECDAVVCGMQVDKQTNVWSDAGTCYAYAIRITHVSVSVHNFLNPYFSLSLSFTQQLMNLKHLVGYV